MRALRFHSFGTPSSVLRFEEIPTPTASDGQLLVQVRAAAINPSDVSNVGGRFSQTTLPRIPGRDFSGIVVSKGQYLGKEVWGTGPGLGLTLDGAHAVYISVPAEFVAPKPKTLTFEQAAAIGVPFTTAWAAVIGAAQLKAGETILIVGAAGAVGDAAVQIANWKQARVFAAVKGSDPVPGAQAVIDTNKDLRHQVLDSTGGKGVDVVFDVVGGPMFEPALRSLRLGGRQVAVASAGGSRVSFDLVDFYHNRAHLIGVDSNKFDPSELRTIMAELNRGFEVGSLKPLNRQSVPFDRAIASYEEVAAQPGTTKQVLTF
jgi:NADPH:quinone reductase-like Zn-dependent oxidoreductase